MIQLIETDQQLTKEQYQYEQQQNQLYQEEQDIYNQIQVSKKHLQSLVDEQFQQQKDQQKSIVIYQLLNNEQQTLNYINAIQSNNNLIMSVHNYLQNNQFEQALTLVANVFSYQNLLGTDMLSEHKLTIDELKEKSQQYIEQQMYNIAQGTNNITTIQLYNSQQFMFLIFNDIINNTEQYIKQLIQAFTIYLSNYNKSMIITVNQIVQTLTQFYQMSYDMIQKLQQWKQNYIQNDNMQKLFKITELNIDQQISKIENQINAQINDKLTELIDEICNLQNIKEDYNQFFSLFLILIQMQKKFETFLPLSIQNTKKLTDQYEQDELQEFSEIIKQQIDIQSIFNAYNNSQQRLNKVQVENKDLIEKKLNMILLMYIQTHQNQISDIQSIFNVYINAGKLAKTNPKWNEIEIQWNSKLTGQIQQQVQSFIQQQLNQSIIKIVINQDPEEILETIFDQQNDLTQLLDSQFSNRVLDQLLIQIQQQILSQIIKNNQKVQQQQLIKLNDAMNQIETIFTEKLHRSCANQLQYLRQAIIIMGCYKRQDCYECATVIPDDIIEQLIQLQQIQ